MRKVLFVSYFFPPLGGGGVQRILQTTRFLPKFGWSPTVLTVEQGDWTSKDEAGLARIPPEVTVERTRYFTAARLKQKITGPSSPKPSALPTSGWEEPAQGFKDALVRRFRMLWQTPDEFLGWYPYAVRRGRDLLKAGGYDAIVSSGPPWTSHLIGRKLAEKSGLPWLADFRDGWTLMARNPHGQGLQFRIEMRLERPVLDEAAALVFTNEQMRRDYVEKRAVPASRTHTVTNGFDPDEFAGEVERSKDFVMFYGGTTFAGQRLELLFPAVARLRARHPADNVRIEYAGSEGDALEAAAKSAGLATGPGGGFVNLGYLPHGETIRRLRSAAALLQPGFDEEIARSMYPGKLFEIFASGRPALYVGRDGSTVDLFRELGMGRFVIGVPGTPDVDRALDEALDELLAAHKAGVKMPAAAKIDIYSRFSRVELTRRFAVILDSIAAGPAQAGN